MNKQRGNVCADEGKTDAVGGAFPFQYYYDMVLHRLPQICHAVPSIPLPLDIRESHASYATRAPPQANGYFDW